MSGWDDDDIEKAIALSLQDASLGSKDAPISIDEDEEDIKSSRKDGIDLTAATPEPNSSKPVARPSSVQASSSQAGKTRPINPSTGTYNDSGTVPPAAPFMSDRAKMEQERLERLKRLRPDLSPATKPSSSKRVRSSPPSSDTTTEDEDDDVPQNKVADIKKKTLASTTVSTEGSMFWEAEIRQTANSLADPAKDRNPVFRLSEIIGSKSEVIFALISSYAMDWAWTYQFFDPVTPVICVAQPDETGNSIIKEVLPNWIKTTPFLRMGRGCQHMKFMLLFYKSGRLRIVISTANLVPHDWKEIENTSWVQDLQPRPEPLAPDSNASDFGSRFERVLRSLNVEPALRTFRMNGKDLPLTTISSLRVNWDFSKVRAHLVASIAGKHEGWPDVLRTGHVALMKAVRDLGSAARPGQTLTVECQGSSIGTYSTQWTNEFIGSCRGESAEKWLDAPKTRRAKLPYPAGLKIVFPSLQTVKNSMLGEQGGGTMFCRRSQWEGAKFPRELFHDSNSKRGGVVMHSKMIIGVLGRKNDVMALANAASSSSRRPSKTARKKNEHDSDIEDLDSDLEEIQEVEPPQPYGWAYIGSHNFTPSAWGTLSGSSFNPTLNIVNYELGIVIPLKNAEQASQVACFQRPPRKYDLKKDVPWMQDESEALTGNVD